jgi:hypothetical protein
MIRLVVCSLTVAILIAACSSNEIRIAPAVYGSLKNEQQILAVHYIPAQFSAHTPEVMNAGGAAMMFGAVGGAVAGAIQAREAEESGRQIVKDYGLEDPMLQIKRTFLESVSREQSLQNLQSLNEALESDNPEALRERFRKGLVFDFKTTSWSLNQAGPLSPNTYRVYYEGRVRLLRLPEGVIEWQSFCQSEGKIEESAPTLLQVVANSGAILKSQLNSAADSCLRQIERQFRVKP